MSTEPYGDVERSEAIRERARQRAHPRLIKRDVTQLMEELGQRNAADRAAARDRLSRHYARQDQQAARVNRLSAMRPITQDFARFAEAEVGDPTIAAWAQAVWEQTTDDWLVLLGAVGVGKTWQAVAAYRAVVESTGCDGTAWRAATLLMRATSADGDSVPWSLLEDTDLLLLDDVPGALTDHDRRVLLRLIDTRQARRRRTIITANLDRAEVRPMLGDQLASRLSTGTRVVVMDGPDRRRLREPTYPGV
jgi:DNA replication protein DnaC